MKVALVCCGRLENRYVQEFVDYYKQLGIDHILIADNNREGEEHFEDVLQRYINDGFVSIYNFRNVTEYAQYESYFSLYYKCSEDYDWVYFCDIDEYLTLPKDNNIKDYLSRECFKDANQILINWQTYTDNDLIYDDGRPCLERFTATMDLDKTIEEDWLIKNRVCKPILRTNLYNLEYQTVHMFKSDLLRKTTYNSKGKKVKEFQIWQPINYDYAYIKHFSTKTIDEYINNKWKRGTGDRPYENFLNEYGLDVFFKYNDITEEKLNYLKEHGIEYKVSE